MASSYHEEMQEVFRNNNKSREFPAHNAKVHSVAWSCDGKRLASGSFDKTASVFVLEKDRLVKENNYRGHGDSVDQLCWHPTNPDLFVTASGDKTIRIWDVRTTKCMATVSTKGENINICWSPDGQTIAVGNKDDVVTFIDAKTHRPRAEEQFKFEIDIAEVETGEKLWEIQCESPTFTVAWHPKRPLLAYACDDKEGKYDSNREAGTVKLFGLPNDS
ncbi:THO complex subunit 3-like [Sinocyclocheilus grahami]|uniref:THO complex subunit 3-like n=1 Tax=Sinocyclocheilus grahami TaxID=75366 RepID=UPI0007AD531D|nr:PREDICTED: THO complex subunit 3-like [Sinocyclocheilus grahami]